MLDRGLAKKVCVGPEKHGGETWRDDRTGVTHRMWEWWRVKASKLEYFFARARHIALVLISSTSVERVCSDVKFITDTIGESILEETLDMNVMEQYNAY